MARTDVKGLHYVTVRRSGQPTRHYVYAWRGGPRIMVTTGGGRPALDVAAMELLNEALKATASRPGDTLGSLAAEWRGSSAWSAMAPATRRVWGGVLSAIEAKWGEVPLAVFEDRKVKAKIVALRDSLASTPRTADYHIQVLRALLAYGRLTGQLAVNMADGIPQLYKGGQRAAIIWEPEEVAVWQGASLAMTDVVNLARLTGLRRGDLVALPWSAVKSHAIIWQTSKSGRTQTVSIPILPELRKLLEVLAGRQRVNGVETVLVSSFGRPWTPTGLNSSFHTERGRLKLPSKHLHDFRGTFCTELCLAELNDRQIADIMGWTVEQVSTIRRLYVDQAKTVVAIGERLANSGVKLGVKQSSQ
jgi:integrase